MSIASLIQLPETREQWDDWGFANMAHHRDIIRRIYELTGNNLTESVLDPFDHMNPETWLTKHYLMHQHMDAVLGIQGFNLEDVDWEDREAMRNWIAAHANEHYQAGTILNIG